MSSENKSNRFAQFVEYLRGISARGIVQGIESGYDRFKKLIEKARSTFYRLVVINNDTLEQVGTYRLSLMNLYVLISGLVVGFTLLVVSIIIFTPLKRYIPGYGGIGSQRDMFVLEERVDSLERAITAHETYTTNIRKMLTSDVQKESDIPRDKINAVTDSNVNVEPNEAEMKIRAGGNSPFDGDEEVSSGSASKAIKVSGNGDRLEKMFLASPISGQVTLGFSLNKKHYGIDIIAPKNTPIKTISDGFVISADWTLETGNTIAVQHSNNVVSFYKHNSSLLKKVGDRVKSGEAIAIIGNTGEQTTGPHLHFELWKDGLPLNPAEYIRF
jgi:murein DD-endopeptidase MepM/ murein hydrolase activator NlpD